MRRAESLVGALEVAVGMLAAVLTGGLAWLAMAWAVPAAGAGGVASWAVAAAALVAGVGGAIAARVLRRHLRRHAEAQAHLACIMDSSPEMIWSVDPRGFGLLSYNHAVRDWFASVHGVTLRPGLRPNDLWRDAAVVEKWCGLYRRCLAEGAVQIEHVGGDGRTVLQVGFQRMLDGGAVVGVSVFGRDVTEERRRLHEQQSQRELLRKLIESIPGVFYVFDADGRYLMWNANLERALGLDARGFEQLRPMHIIAVEDRERVAQAIERTFAQGEGVVEARVRTADGREVPFLLNGYRIDWQGRPALLGVGLDISARVQAEAALRQHQEQLEVLVAERTRELSQAMYAAQAAAQAKGAFLANMSHEIRTPIHAVMGLAHLLRRDAPTPAQSARLDKLLGAATQLLGIVDAVLDLSNLEAGEVRLDEAAVQVERVVAEVAAAIEPGAAAKGLRLLTDVPPLPEGLRGDALRLRQALSNYASNALKFTERGSVTLRVRLLAEDPDSVLLRFEVEDTGVGVPHEALPRLFESFEQADNSTTRRYGGTGLGLALTRKLAALMGGEAGADSRLGQGSRFWFIARLRRGGGDPAITSSAPGVLAPR